MSDVAEDQVTWFDEHSSFLACRVRAAWIAYDIWGLGYRQHVRVMEAVWPVTALYIGPAFLTAYRK